MRSDHRRSASLWCAALCVAAAMLGVASLAATASRADASASARPAAPSEARQGEQLTRVLIPRRLRLIMTYQKVATA